MEPNQSPTQVNGPDSFVGSLFADRYRVMRVVSEGAKTLIADAIDEQTGRNCTLKIVRARLSAQPSVRDRFDETMRGVAAMSHPNIAAVYDWGFAPIGSASVAYVVVEQLTGGSLRDMFDRGRQLTPSQGLTVGLEACRALDYAHRRGFVHGELTPAKIVFGDDRRLRIIDFGLSDLLSSEAWEHLDSLPTHIAWYAAPEQGPGQPIDGKADVYALSLILHEAVTGTLPFKSDSTVATLAARQNKLMPVSADLGPLAAILERSGRPEPSERASAAELGSGLVKAASKLPRPDPLPLLSTGLFDVPAEEIRAPHDPTGGILRPQGTEGAAVRIVSPAQPSAPAPEQPSRNPDAVPSAVRTSPPADVRSTPQHSTPQHSTPVQKPGPQKTAARKAAARKLAERRSAGTLEHEQGVADGADLAGLSRPSRGLPASVGVDPDMVTEAIEVIVPTPVPDPPVIIEAEPDLELAQPVVDDLVIVPVTDIAEPASKAKSGRKLGRRSQPSAPVASSTSATPAAPPSGDTDGSTGWVDTDEDSTDSSSRRGRLARILVGAFIAVALIGLGAVAYTMFRPSSHPVPDLVGLPEAQASSEIGSFGWVVSVEHERSDEVPEAGKVARTVPAAGVEVPKGDPFLMVISDGPVLREIPNLNGMTSADAQTQLRDLQLNATVSNDFDENVPVDSVISWSVEGQPGIVAGNSVAPGSTVHLVVSKGPAPRVVPNLVGRTSDEAAKMLGDLRLVPTEGGREFSDTVPAGAVISQSPLPDTSVARDSAVTFVVSNGPDLVTFPELERGLTYNDVYQKLIDAGFQVHLVLGDAQGVVSSYKINDQPAEAGQTFKRGTQVDITAV